MTHYRQNATWLVWSAPFRDLVLAAAYLTPFFQQHGLSLSQILTLQSVFSAAVLLWEVPSGMVADRFGRAFSIKLGAPLSALAVTLYGFSNHYWQFVCMELLMALAYGLNSGVDTALLQDSLRADGLDEKEVDRQFTQISRRSDKYRYLAVGLGVPVAWLLATYVSLSSTLVVDGLLSGVGVFFSFKMREAPRYNGSQEAIRLSAWRAGMNLVRSGEARWLVLLGAVLYTSTLVTFWMSAPYFSHLGVPVAAFGAVLALRSFWKAWLTHHYEEQSGSVRSMWVYAALAGGVYLAMATGSVWLVVMVLGHDVVQALSRQPVTAKLNEHFVHEYRATMNSLVNLAQRLLFAVAGPGVGWLADRYGLSTSFAVTGLVFGATAFVALARLKRYGTFLAPR